MNLRPLQDRIIVKRVDEAEGTSAGGIIIPDSAKEKPQQAEVVAVGNGKAGDKILIGKYSGSEVKIDNEELVILREDEVLAVIE